MGGEISMSRRGLLRAASGAALAGGGGAVLAGDASAADRGRGADRGAAGVRLRWLGVAGWQLAFDEHVLWFDPYLSRFDYRADPSLRIRTDVIDELLASGRVTGPPEVIMLSHGHFDHLADVPHLLRRPEWATRKIRTIGTETHRHLLTRMGAPTGGIIEASGGEYLSFADGGYTVQVIRSLHSQGADYGYAAPGTLSTPPPPPAPQPPAPQTINDLLEGGTLAYLVTVPDRLSVLLFGATNFIERELAGLRPDVVVVSMTFHTAVHRYLEPLLSVLGGPRYVIPSHHDDMVTGFDDPALPGTVRANAAAQLREVVRKLGLRTKVLEPTHLTDIAW